VRQTINEAVFIAATKTAIDQLIARGHAVRLCSTVHEVVAALRCPQCGEIKATTNKTGHFVTCVCGLDTNLPDLLQKLGEKFGIVVDLPPELGRGKKVVAPKDDDRKSAGPWGDRMRSNKQGGPRDPMLLG